MPRVDFVGAPGAGKTTLYRFLAERRGEGDRWLTRNESVALPQVIPKGWREYLAYCKQLDGVGLPERLHKRLVKLARRSAAAEVADHVVVFDESVTLRGLSTALRTIYRPDRPAPNWAPLFMMRAAHARRVARKYFAWLPPPAGVVHVTSGADVVLARLRERNKTAPIHVGLEQEQIARLTQVALKMSADAANVLQSRGSRILTLDTSAEPESQVLIASEFLRSLEKEPPPSS